jgi:tripartite-type tricarboxylate transporter receptor subunit TctC
MRHTIPAALAFALALPAAAQETFPSKPITLVVPFAAGGGTDVIARLLAEGITQKFGQNVVVENRAGAGGIVANKAVIAAPADGYTVLIGTAGTQAAGPAFNPTSGFNPLLDLVPVARLGTTPNLLVVHPEVPARSVPELVALARQKPTSLSFASSGQGTVSHLSALLFGRLAKIEMTHVPYRGAGPANNDLVAGQVQAMFDVPITLLPLVRAGKLRVLAVTTKSRFSALPDVPALREVGFPDYESELWIGLFAPRATPEAVVKRIAAVFLEVLDQNEVGERMTQLGFERAAGDGKALHEILRADHERWRRLMSETGVKPE